MDVADARLDDDALDSRLDDAVDAERADGLTSFRLLPLPETGEIPPSSKLVFANGLLMLLGGRDGCSPSTVAGSGDSGMGRKNIDCIVGY